MADIDDVKLDTEISKELAEELNRGESDLTDEDPASCWGNFVGILGSFWQTTDMQFGEEREVIVRTSLRELGIYLVFLALLCVGKIIPATIP